MIPALASKYLSICDRMIDRAKLFSCRSCVIDGFEGWHRPVDESAMLVVMQYLNEKNYITSFENNRLTVSW